MAARNTTPVRPGPKRRSTGEFAIFTTRLAADVFNEMSTVLDRDGLTQREFVEAAIRRELARIERRENRKGAANGGK